LQLSLLIFSLRATTNFANSVLKKSEFFRLQNAIRYSQILDEYMNHQICTRPDSMYSAFFVLLDKRGTRWFSTRLKRARDNEFILGPQNPPTPSLIPHSLGADYFLRSLNSTQPLIIAQCH
jgi:hypothetical protein